MRSYATWSIDDTVWADGRAVALRCVNAIAAEAAIIDKAQVLSAFPRLGRSIAGREEYRQLVLQVLNATYVFQYRFDGSRLVILRVYHGREQRG